VRANTVRSSGLDNCLLETTIGACLDDSPPFYSGGCYGVEEESFLGLTGLDRHTRFGDFVENSHVGRN
jgi:hypothetical protein